MRRLLLCSGLIGGLGSGWAACGGEPAASVCTPGKVDVCPCPGGEFGSQACNDAGSGYEDCVCPGDTMGGDGDATSGDSMTGDPTTGDPDTGTPDTGDPTTGDPTTGDPTTGGDGDGDGESITLQNDSFVSGGMAFFQGGFVTDECWGSIYEVPAGVDAFSLDRAIVLVGDSGNAAFEVMIYGLADNAVDPQNGVQLFQSGFDLQGSMTAYNEVLIDGVGPFSYPRVSLIFCHVAHDGYPSISRDQDGYVAGANYIKAQGIGWVEAFTLGVAGDWISRLVITPQ